MKPTLHQKFISAVVGLSILITASGAAPARADSKDTGRALAAILGLAIVGAVIADSNKDKKRAKAVHPQPRVRSNHDPFVQPRPLPRQVSRKILPQRCLHNFPGRNGSFPAFGRNCLNRHFQHAGHLPRHCYTEVRTNRGARGVYGARCLRQNGYQLARR